MKWTATGAALLALCAPVSLAAGDARAEGGVSSRSSPIVGGVDAPEDLSVVQVTSPGREGTSRTGCGGTVVAPNLVLTARHCIADFENIDFECDPSLPNGGGPTIRAAAAPGDVRVYVSATFVDEGAPGAPPPPSAVGIDLFASENLAICGNDVALVLLDRDLGVPRVPVRLGPTLPGEEVYAVGWGRVNTRGVTPARLQRRDGLNVLAIGPDRYQMLPGNDYRPMSMVSGELLLGQVGCNGDSGSPLRSRETNAIVGVLSYLLNVYPEKKEGTVYEPVPWCGEGAATFYHSLNDRDFVLEAFEKSGHRPWLEGRPEPALMGASCSVAEDCDSGLCLAGGGAPYCSTACTADGGCPDGFLCLTIGGQALCSRNDPNAAEGGGGGGCGVGAASRPFGGGAALLGAMLGALTLFRRRR